MARLRVRQLAWLALVISVIGLANVFRVLTTDKQQQEAGDTDQSSQDTYVTRKVRVDEDNESGLSPKVALSLNMTLPSELQTTKHLWDYVETEQSWKECNSPRYQRQLTGPLATVSVIISFYDNENVSSILMTVHSVIQRTPPELLREVILVDDCTTKDDFKQTLEMYIKHVFGGKVILLRSAVPLGLIRARLRGIRMASGQVVVVMDSHMEVQPFWLEPLLYEIRNARKTLAASSLDWLEKTGRNWIYRHGGTLWKSFFDWTMSFGYQGLSEMDRRQRRSLTEAVVSPVIIGCILAIEKDFFTEIGEYDEQMQKWGGENLDLPIRVWLFGGRVVNVPCSRAAHVETPGNRAYRIDWDKIIHRNYQRIVEVWMDGYKDNFYYYFPKLKGKPVENLAPRLALKKRALHNFTWFLDNVFPELGLQDRDSFAFGGVRNIQHPDFCLDFLTGTDLQLFSCFPGQPTQSFYWSKEGHLRFVMQIFNVVRRGELFEVEQQDYMTYYKTTAGTVWVHWQNGPLMDTTSKRCLEAMGTNHVRLMPCRIEQASQQWAFTQYTPAYNDMLSGHQRAYSRMKKKIDRLKRTSDFVGSFNS